MAKMNVLVKDVRCAWRTLRLRPPQNHQNDSLMGWVLVALDAQVRLCFSIFVKNICLFNIC